MSDTTSEAWSIFDTEMFVKYGQACVPRRPEQISTVCDLLAELPVAHVLDLCCGEGLLSQEYLRRTPQARVTLLDGSAEMLQAAATRLAPFGDRFTQVQADIADRDWRVAGRYGGVMTSLAVHHLDADGKQQLYRDLHGMLPPGGVFVMADLIEPTGPVARGVAADAWEQSVAEESRRLFGTDEALVAFRQTEWNYFRQPGPDSFDMPSSVAEHLTWLSAAGLAEVDLVWLYAGHAIFTAKRPAES
ncbi:MAG TPA: methyltransferase domain-containing protein [Streptosporangiaceae bacterium]